MKLKIPPPVWALITAICIWLSARYWPEVKLEFAGQILATILFAIVGIAIDVMAMTQFRNAQTTINPLAPDNAASLVTTGIYGVSRNPMYLGMTLMLTSFMVWTGNPLGLIFIFLFAWIITELQIKPEEEILEAKFGDTYSQWTKRVRRWI